MLVQPPEPALFDQPPWKLMDLFGRMRSFTDQAGFSGTLPVVWQCSDESQQIKKSLLGYVYDCPVFNLGRVGALIDPTRLVTASHHGQDLILLGGSHLGGKDEKGIGFVERIHQNVAPCCGMLHRLLTPYWELYQRASSIINLRNSPSGVMVEIPYQFLLRKRTDVHEHPHVHLRLKNLVVGEAIKDSSQGKLFHLNEKFQSRNLAALLQIGVDPVAIGPMLDLNCFYFTKQINKGSRDPVALLEDSVFDFMPDIVTNPYPHRRIADINTWRQFHRAADFLLNTFDNGQRNIFVVAGLTLDHSLKHNSFVPQFGFWIKKGRTLNSRYFNATEINELLFKQTPYYPSKTFLQYAEIE
ncbi:MAG: hypothetical protein JRE16_08805 [Deltaproteobacteria bacterium]|jgi:hypothetical protein|nr:hypothetical protein [Deltaproteobacteria bacterium]